MKFETEDLVSHIKWYNSSDNVKESRKAASVVFPVIIGIVLSIMFGIRAIYLLPLIWTAVGAAIYFFGKGARGEWTPTWLIGLTRYVGKGDYPSALAFFKPIIQLGGIEGELADSARKAWIALGDKIHASGFEGKSAQDVYHSEVTDLRNLTTQVLNRSETEGVPEVLKLSMELEAQDTVDQYLDQQKEKEFA